MIAGVIASQSVGGDPLQTLRDACTYYTSLDLDTINSNGNYVPEVGHGTLINNNSTNNNAGIINECFQTNNQPNTFLIGDAATENYDGLIFNNGTSNNSFSVSCWLNIGSFNQLQNIISIRGVSVSNPTREPGHLLFINAGFLRVNVIDNNGGFISYLYSDSHFALNAFFHFAYHFDAPNNTIAAFLNGNMLMPDQVINNGFNVMDNEEVVFTISRGITNTTQLNGKIDEVYIAKNYLLTQNDADILYNNGNGIQLF